MSHRRFRFSLGRLIAATTLVALCVAAIVLIRERNELRRERFLRDVEALRLEGLEVYLWPAKVDLFCQMPAVKAYIRLKETSTSVWQMGGKSFQSIDDAVSAYMALQDKANAAGIRDIIVIATDKKNNSVALP